MFRHILRKSHLANRQIIGDRKLSVCLVERSTSATKNQDNEKVAGKGPADASLSMTSKYTKEENEKILNIINSLHLSQLLSYDISKTRASKLVAWRNRNGPLKQLDDIFSVDGFGLKVVDKFYRSLLQEIRPNDEKSRIRIASFITPTIDPEQQRSIRSCVSLCVGVTSVTWARLQLAEEAANEPCLLTHWQHQEISEKKLHLNDLVHRCLYVNHAIPTADCYLFESPQMAQVSSNPGSVDQQNVNIQKAQVTAIFGYALAARNSFEEKRNEVGNPKKLISWSNVFYLRRFLSARLFHHLVGTERVSSEESVLKLMRTHYNIEERLDWLEEDDHIEDALKDSLTSEDTKLSIRGNVQFPPELREMFAHSPRYHREFLGQALLLNLAFVRLVLLQDADSIAAINRNSNKR